MLKRYYGRNPRSAEGHLLAVIRPRNGWGAVRKLVVENLTIEAQPL